MYLNTLQVVNVPTIYQFELMILVFNPLQISMVILTRTFYESTDLKILYANYHSFIVLL